MSEQTRQTVTVTYTREQALEVYHTAREEWNDAKKRAGANVSTKRKAAIQDLVFMFGLYTTTFSALWPTLVASRGWHS